jgi:hypothetical protein
MSIFFTKMENWKAKQILSEGKVIAGGVKI